ncbi:MAG TPA: site-specific integrase [Gemmataceae bacterium]|jgi:integrase
MARKPSVRYWPTRNAYCCWFRGKQYILAEGPKDEMNGPTYLLAIKKFAELVTLHQADTARDANPVRVICETFLTRKQADMSEASLEKYVKFLRSFVDHVDPDGSFPVGRLTPEIVNRWLDAGRRGHVQASGRRNRWGETTVNIAAKVVRSVFRWASNPRKGNLISVNPLDGFSAGRVRSRGREALIGKTPEERAANHARIVKAAPKSFRPFIVCLEATGARPSELANATADAFDGHLGAIVYHSEYNRLDGEYQHKTARRDKDRIIFLTGEALEVVKDLVRQHPRGYLFRPSRAPNRGKGKGKWTRHTICAYFNLIRQKVRIPKLTAYSYRHTFATAWLEQGKPIDQLAALLGNTPETLRKHYSHLLGDSANLRRQLEAFRQSAGTDSSRPVASDGADSGLASGPAPAPE